MAQVKTLRLGNYCRSSSSLHYHLSELINIAQTPNNFSTLRVYNIMSHRGAMNHFHQNRNFLRRVQRTKSLLITESAAIRIDLTLHECTTLPTRRKDHATHPTGQSWIRGYSRQPFPTKLNH